MNVEQLKIDAQAFLAEAKRYRDLAEQYREKKEFQVNMESFLETARDYERKASKCFLKVIECLTNN